MRQAFRIPPALFAAVLLVGCSKTDTPAPGPVAGPAIPAKSDAVVPPPKPTGEEPIPDFPPLPDDPPEAPAVYDDIPPAVTAQVLNAVGGRPCHFEPQYDGRIGSSADGARARQALPGFHVSNLTEKGVAAMPVVPAPFGLEIERTALKPAVCALLAKQPNLVRFVVGESCTCDSACLKELAKAPALRELSMEHSVRGPAPDLAALGEFQSLRALRLANYKTLPDPALKAIGSLKNLRDLDIYDCGDGSVAGYAHFANLTELRALRMTLTRLPADALPALSRLRKLETLDLEHTNGLSDHGLRHLAPLGRLRVLHYQGETAAPSPKVLEASAAALARLTNLEELHLQTSYSATTADPVLTHVAACRKLKRLQLEWLKKATPAGLAKLAALKDLESLTLSDVPAGVLDFWAALATLPKLRSLDVKSSPGFDDAALQALTAAPALTTLSIYGGEKPALTAAGFDKIDRLKTLTELTITVPAIGGKVMAPISRLPAIQGLHFMAAPDMTDADAMELAKAKTLRRVTFSDTIKQLKPETITALRKALPACQFPEY